MKKRRLILAGFGWLLVWINVFGQNSALESFDASHPLKLTGIPVSAFFQAPNVPEPKAIMNILVKDANGNDVEWAVEVSCSKDWLERAGLIFEKRSSTGPDVITVVAYPLKPGVQARPPAPPAMVNAGRFVHGVELTLDSGKKLSLADCR